MPEISSAFRSSAWPNWACSRRDAAAGRSDAQRPRRSVPAVGGAAFVLLIGRSTSRTCRWRDRASGARAGHPTGAWRRPVPGDAAIDLRGHAPRWNRWRRKHRGRILATRDPGIQWNGEYAERGVRPAGLDRRRLHGGGLSARRRADRTGARGNGRSLNVNQILADGSRLGTGGAGDPCLSRGLVVTQVAFSVVLLIGAGLLLTSFRNLLAVDAGFDAQRSPRQRFFRRRRDTPMACPGRIVQSRARIGAQPSRRGCRRHHVEHRIERADRTGDGLCCRFQPATRRHVGAAVGGQRHTRILRSDGHASCSWPLLC